MIKITKNLEILLGSWLNTLIYIPWICYLVLKRRVETIGTKIEPLEPKLELQDFGRRWCTEVRTRVVSTGHESCPAPQQISSLVFLYYLSNSNNSNFYSLKYDEKWVVQELNIIGKHKGIMVILMTIMMLSCRKDEEKI